MIVGYDKIKPCDPGDRDGSSVCNESVRQGYKLSSKHDIYEFESEIVNDLNDKDK